MNKTVVIVLDFANTEVHVLTTDLTDNDDIARWLQDEHEFKETEIDWMSAPKDTVKMFYLGHKIGMW